MVSCPCAIVISVPLSFFGGLGTCSREGILVKGADHLETLARCDVGVFDKTGTLTEAQPRLACVLTTDGWSEDEVLRLSQISGLAEMFADKEFSEAWEAV